MITLSRRQADSSKLLTSLERDPTFQQQFLHGAFGAEQLGEAIRYVVQTYSCAETEAEEAIQHLLRQSQRTALSRLTSRHGQTEKQIVIPGTADHPAGRTVPLAEKPAALTPPKDLTIDAQPAATPQDKAEDLVKPLKETGQSRQQNVIDAIKAEKVAGNELAKAMYGVELTDESQGKYVTTCIETISKLMAAQTAATVKLLASPLIGQP